MQDSEDGHFHGDQEIGQSHFQIAGVQFLGRFDGPGGIKKGYHTLRDRVSGVLRGLTDMEVTYRLPEGKENHQLDGENLQKRLMLTNVLLDLDIKLDQAIHGNRYGDTLDRHHLSI